MTTIAKLQKRQKQLNSLIIKFAGIKSLIRKWAVELTTIEGQIEKLESETIPTDWIQDVKALIEIIKKEYKLEASYEIVSSEYKSLYFYFGSKKLLLRKYRGYWERLHKNFVDNYTPMMLRYTPQQEPYTLNEFVIDIIERSYPKAA